MKCLPNIGQIPDQEGKTWEMESTIEALQCELVNPKSTQEREKTQERRLRRENTCRLAVIRLHPFPVVNLEETLENTGSQAPDSWITYQGNNFNEPWLVHLPIHRKMQNFLTWDTASWVWSPIFLSWQVQSRHFPKRN